MVAAEEEELKYLTGGSELEVELSSHWSQIFGTYLVSRLFHILLHNYTTQISNVFHLVLWHHFHVGQTNQWQEKEEIGKLFFFFPELFF